MSVHAGHGGCIIYCFLRNSGYLLMPDLSLALSISGPWLSDNSSDDSCSCLKSVLQRSGESSLILATVRCFFCDTLVMTNHQLGLTCVYHHGCGSWHTVSGKYKVAVARFPVQRKAGKTEINQRESESQRRRHLIPYSLSNLVGPWRWLVSQHGISFSRYDKSDYRQLNITWATIDTEIVELVWIGLSWLGWTVWTAFRTAENHLLN